MTYRKIAILVSVVFLIVILIIAVNAIFSVRKVFAFSTNMPAALDSRVDEYNQKIPESNIVKKGKSTLFFNKNKIKDNLESHFVDIKIDSIEIDVPSVVRVNYSLVVKAFEIRVVDDEGQKFLQISDDGQVLSITDSAFSIESEQQQIAPIPLFSNITLDGGIKVGDDVSGIVEIEMMKDLIDAFYDFGLSTRDVLGSIDSVMSGIDKGEIYINIKHSGTTFIVKNYSENFAKKVADGMTMYYSADEYTTGIIEIDNKGATHRPRGQDEWYLQGDWRV